MAADTSPPGTTRPTDPGPVRALVVDDDPDVAEMLREALVLDGMQVVLASACEQAIRHAETGEIDVALVDLSVETDDERVIEPLTSLGVPVVVFGTEQTEQEGALARGARLVLHKPHDVLTVGDSLLAVVRGR